MHFAGGACTLQTWRVLCAKRACTLQEWHVQCKTSVYSMSPTHSSMHFSTCALQLQHRSLGMRSINHEKCWGMGKFAFFSLLCLTGSRASTGPGVHRAPAHPESGKFLPGAEHGLWSNRFVLSSGPSGCVSAEKKPHPWGIRWGHMGESIKMIPIGTGQLAAGRARAQPPAPGHTQVTAVRLSARLSICPPIRLSVHPSVCLSTRPSLRLSTRPSACPSKLGSNRGDESWPTQWVFSRFFGDGTEGLEMGGWAAGGGRGGGWVWSLPALLHPCCGALRPQEFAVLRFVAPLFPILRSPSSSHGLHPMVSIPWSPFCGLHLMVSILWPPLFGVHLMVSILWSPSHGLHFVVSILWSPSYGLHLIVSIRGSPSYGLHLMVYILWPSSHGLHFMASILWSPSHGFHLTVSISWFPPHGLHLYRRLLLRNRLLPF